MAVFLWFFEETGLLGVLDCLLGVLGYGLGVPDSYWAFSAMDWAFRRRLFEGDYSRRLFEGDYSKETIRRSGAHDIFGVAHTIFLEWRTRYFLEWCTRYFLEWRTRYFSIELDD